MADDDKKWTAAKFAWLRQVASDKRVTGGSAKLAIILIDLFNREHDGWAWPNQTTLAGRMGLTTRAVGHLPASLVANGHLEMTEGKGPGQSNRYRMILKPASENAKTSSDLNRKASSHLNRKTSSDIEASKPEEDGQETGRGAQCLRKNSVDNTGRPLPPIPFTGIPLDSHYDSSYGGTGDKDASHEKVRIDSDLCAPPKAAPKPKSILTQEEAEDCVTVSPTVEFPDRNIRDTLVMAVATFRGKPFALNDWPTWGNRDQLNAALAWLIQQGHVQLTSRQFRVISKAVVHVLDSEMRAHA